ncbi:MAG: TetR/AcrR family transcriptional regulator [Anaerolineae bacterium]
MADKRAARKERLIKERRAQILEAATRVFARKGYRGATIREIAAEAGVAEGTIYNYFKNKDDILISLPRQLGEPILLAFSPQTLQVRKVQDDEEFLVQLFNQGIEGALQSIDVLKVLFSTVPTMDEEAKEEFLQRTPLYAAGKIQQYLQLRINQGVFREMNTAIVARALLGMLLIFLLSQEILPGRRVTPFEYDEVAREVVRLFLYGVVAH